MTDTLTFHAHGQPCPGQRSNNDGTTVTCDLPNTARMHAYAGHVAVAPRSADVIYVWPVDDADRARWGTARHPGKPLPLAALDDAALAAVAADLDTAVTILRADPTAAGTYDTTGRPVLSALLTYVRKAQP